MPQGNRDAKPRAWTTDAILALVDPQTRRLIRRAISGSGIGGGAGDHGLLVGLGDDDHLQYLPDIAGTGGTGITVTGRVIKTNQQAVVPSTSRPNRTASPDPNARITELQGPIT